MSAIISQCGLYRPRLDRDVQLDGIVAALFGVNPSTAGPTANDATIRKDIGFAKVNGWRRFIKGNVFDYRSTNVKALARCVAPASPDNDRILDQIIAEADVLVPCWGSRVKVPKALHPQIDRLADRIFAAGKPVLIFGLTASGDPLHPLMLGYDTQLVPWSREA